MSNGNEIKQTLSDRLETIFTRASQARERVPLSNVEFCIVCGKPRLDAEPTGVTCGNQRCIEEAGKIAKNKYLEMELDGEEKIMKIAEALGIKTSGQTLDFILDACITEIRNLRHILLQMEKNAG